MGGSIALTLTERWHAKLNVDPQIANVAKSRTAAEQLLPKTKTGLEAPKYCTACPHPPVGGPWQRVLMAQELPLAPSVIVADEPTSARKPSLKCNHATV